MALRPIRRWSRTLEFRAGGVNSKLVFQSLDLSCKTYIHMLYDFSLIATTVDNLCNRGIVERGSWHREHHL